MIPTACQHRAWYIAHAARRRIPVDQTAANIFVSRMTDQIKCRERGIDALTLESIRLREFNTLQKQAKT
jgi:hypothetical protein